MGRLTPEQKKQAMLVTPSGLASDEAAPPGETESPVGTESEGAATEAAEEAPAFEQEQQARIEADRAEEEAAKRRAMRTDPRPQPSPAFANMQFWTAGGTLVTDPEILRSLRRQYEQTGASPGYLTRDPMRGGVLDAGSQSQAFGDMTPPKGPPEQ